MEELMQQYGDNEAGGYTPYGTLLHSIFYTVVGDFGKYVIQPTLRHFSRHPLSSSRPQIGRRETYPEELGQRWVFERVLSLGWTPEKFAEFDHYQNQRSYWAVGRSGHKPERFGKKYQWIALRELIARIADNFHMVGRLLSSAGDLCRTVAVLWSGY